MFGRDIWFFLFFCGLFALNWPFLYIFSYSLPAYLFSAWALLIVALFLLSRVATKQDNR